MSPPQITVPSFPLALAAVFGGAAALLKGFDVYSKQKARDVCSSLCSILAVSGVAFLAAHHSLRQQTFVDALIARPFDGEQAIRSAFGRAGLRSGVYLTLLGATSMSTAVAVRADIPFSAIAIVVPSTFAVALLGLPFVTPFLGACYVLGVASGTFVAQRVAGCLYTYPAETVLRLALSARPLDKAYSARPLAVQCGLLTLSILASLPEAFERLNGGTTVADKWSLSFRHKTKEIENKPPNLPPTPPQQPPPQPPPPNSGGFDV